MISPFYSLLLGALATWRLTHMLSTENGPWNVFEKMRRAAGTGFLAELLACFYCLSLWIAAPLAVALATEWRHRLLLWPALSAGAILLERLSSRDQPAMPVILQESE
jgi:hypothetical protein